MLYFLDMTETEIASYLHLVQSTIHYHKKVFKPDETNFGGNG